MILSSTSVMLIPDGEAPGPREADEEVKLGVGLGVPEVREVVDRRPADEQPDPA